jgi:hypothetical protein
MGCGGGKRRRPQHSSDFCLSPHSVTSSTDLLRFSINQTRAVPSGDTALRNKPMVKYFK